MTYRVQKSNISLSNHFIFLDRPWTLPYFSIKKKIDLVIYNKELLANNENKIRHFFKCYIFCIVKEHQIQFLKSVARYKLMKCMLSCHKHYLSSSMFHVSYTYTKGWHVVLDYVRIYFSIFSSHSCTNQTGNMWNVWPIYNHCHIIVVQHVFK